MLSFYPSFFFQAEDGIRDGHVTGVQTCALPIFTPNISLIPFPGAIIGLTFSSLITRQSITTGPSRSEERRVGKECRCQGSKYPFKQKQNNLITCYKL